ncbi:MAG: AsmA family protein [Gammaproteobacteria bacterium]|nr:AsmA family protein [Gammaproteobacteria bacterium]
MKAFKSLGIALLVVVILFAGVIVALAFVDFDRYKGVIEDQITEATGRRFRIEGDSDLSVSLVPGIVLRDVSLANVPWGTESEMVRVREAELKVAVLPLLSGRIEVRKLILIDPEIVLETDAESRVNWAMGRERTEPEEPEAPESGGVGIDVALYEVRLENAHLLYRDGVSSREMVLNLDELTINRNLSGQLEWRIAALLNEIPVNIDGTTSYLTDLLNNQPFRSEMEGTVGNVAFTMTETVKAALDTTALKLKASVEAPNLETVTGLLGTELPDIAPIRFEGEISDTEGDYRIRLDGKAADIDLALAGTLAKALDGTGINMDYEVKAPDLGTIATIAGTDLPMIGPIELSGKASEAEGFYRLTAVGALADLSVDAQGRIARSFDPDGMTVSAKLEAPNFDTVSKLTGRDIPDIGPLSVKADLTDTGDVYEIALDGSAGKVHVATDGSVAASLDGKGVDMAFALQSPDLKVLGVLGGTDLPAVGPVDVKAKLNDIDGGYRVSALEAKAGDSDLSGEASVAYEAKPMRVVAKLSSTRLNLEPFEKAKPAAKVETKPKEEGAAEADTSKERVFSDDPLPFDRLKEINADIRLDAKSVEMQVRELKDVVIGLKLDDGKLEIQPLQAKSGNGDIKGDVIVDASGSDPKLDIEIDATEVVLGEIKGLKDVVTDGKTSMTIDVKGAGKSMHEIMAGLNGKVVVDVGKGEIDNKAINLIGADIIVQILGAINPFGDKAEKAPMDCAVVNFTIKEGVATTDKGIVLQTDKMFVIGNGQIDLDSEKIDIAIRTQGREALGVNVGDVTKMMGVGGTLAHPTPALDVKGTAAAGATVGAAVMTMGLSYAAQKALETAIKDRTPCLTALGKAPPPEEPKAKDGTGSEGTATQQ